MTRPATVTITLPSEQMQWVLNALAEQPYKHACPVIDSILAQLNAPKPEPEAKPKNAPAEELPAAEREPAPA